MDLDEYPDPKDPHMNRWVEMMARHGGGPIVLYDEKCNVPRLLER